MINYGFILNILYHIVFLYTILLLFFFNIAHKMEQNAFKTLLKKSLTNTFNKFNIHLKLNFFQKQILNKKNIKYLKLKKSNNKNLYNNAIILLICIIVILFIVIPKLYNKKILNLNQIFQLFLENILVFTIICSIEIIFFYNVILEYNPIKASYFIDSFKQFI